MKVRLYDLDGPCQGGAIDLEALCGDDHLLYLQAWEALRATGRFQVGGGAAPLFILVRADSAR